MSATGHRYQKEEVTKLNVKKREVHYSSGLVECYDAIILALGHQAEHFGIRGARNNTYPFKTIQDALQIKQLIEASLKENTTLNKSTSVTVVGGGFTGLEVVGELLRAYGEDQRLCIQLIEKEDYLLSNRERAVSHSILALCEKHGVETYLSTEISSFTKGKINFSDKHKKALSSDITIWTAGMSCSSFSGIDNLTGSSSGLFANPYLQAHDSNDELIEGVFVAGDLASTDRPHAKQAYHALNMGSIAAENCMCMLQERPLKRYVAQPELALLSFGDINTYAISPFGAGSSPVLAAAKESVFQLQMANLSRGLPIQDQLGEIYRRYLRGLNQLALPQLRRFNPLNILAQSKLLRVSNR